ncbi:MAG TPA: peptidylprolyl isomerase, partial [Burkholderiales bacterium]|nr:peptidylprolyl isomerase [Burkholderiales bacterium]
MAANEHAKPGLEEVRRVLLARASQLGLKGEEDEVLERLLEAEVPEVGLDEEDCRRYYEQNARRFSSGELVEASHILLAVTPRVPPERLRAKAAQVHAL